MITKVTSFIFSIGNFIAVTPLYSNGEITVVRKFYGLFFAIVLTISILVSTINRDFYRNIPTVPAIERTVLDINMAVLNYYVIFSVIFWKRTQWQDLVKILHVLIDKNCFSFAVVFLLAQIFDVAFLVTAFSLKLDLMGFEYIKKYNFVYVQDYMIFFCNTFICFILSIVLLKYKQIYYSLLHTYQIETIERVQHRLRFLKFVNDSFNNIFGWPIFLIISYTTLHLLCHFDNIFVTSISQKYGSIPTKKIIADFSILFLCFFGTASMILICDAVRIEAEKILTISYKLTEFYNKEVHLTKVILKNFPTFSAARFFNVDRSTLFKVLTSVIGFFIVIVQIRQN
ncbi:gustatory receptor 68a-like [Tribolium madens]|uniref:gustatory receptor 68a-like n=1 Tax=Tribolium madens TaxID=41895 RepID=UPI001CF7397E|nr:gustatory receptor 68a-like [Tribolium madens]